MENNVEIRQILPEDDPFLAKIVRDALEDFGANLPGTVYFDPTTDHLSEVFNTKGSKYFVALLDRTIVGGGGYYPTAGLPDKTCELVKMYINNQYRGKGIGKLLLEYSMKYASDDGYESMYLETLPQLQQAVGLYEKYGFSKLNGPMGNSGHFGCNMWMLKELKGES